MDNQNGGQLSSAEKQRQTLTQMASREVDEAYRRQSQNYRSPSGNSIQPQVNNEDWRKYHSAWQEYYQKYYGSYYGKAAQEYVQRERKKFETEQEERKKRAHAAIEAAALAEKNKPTRPIMSAADLAERESGDNTSEQVSMKQIQNDIRAKIRKTATGRAKKMRKSKHFIPLTIGFVIILLGVLLQYNQVIVGKIVGYMSPGSTEVNAITAIDPTVSVAVHDSPVLMIPKINVEVPINFGYANDWRSMNEAMSTGVAHFSMYGANAKPGEIGNFVVSGHSAGNVYQRSDWKFVFSGLTRMSVGDMMYVDYEGTRYAYQITGTNVVDPSDVAALRKIAEDNSGKPMITLITCTPLGTDKYRLLVFGEQVSPDYANAASSEPVAEDDSNKDMAMPSNEKTPLEQLWDWLIGE